MVSPKDVIGRAIQKPPALSRMGARAAHEIAGKRILLTGSSSGIGAAGAEQLAAEGAHVILVARREDELALVADRIRAAGGQASTYATDLTDPAAVDGLVARLNADFGGVDVLINNAGRSIRRSVLKSRDHDFERLISINYLAPVRLTRALLPGMVERGDGHIINVATWAVLFPAAPLFGGYVASKAALATFGDALHVEMSGRGVGVTTLYFPLVRTPMIAPTAQFTNQPSLSAEEAAAWMVRAVRHRPREIAPRISWMTRGMSAVAPGFTRRWWATLR